MKLGQGNIFIGMCQEFCSRGGGGGGLVPGGVVWSGPGGSPIFRGAPILEGLQFFGGGG